MLSCTTPITIRELDASYTLKVGESSYFSLNPVADMLDRIDMEMCQSFTYSYSGIPEHLKGYFRFESETG